MRSLLMLLACVYVAPSMALAQSADVDLICRGRAETIDYGGTNQLTGEDGVVRLHISGSGGVAELPALIGGKNHAALQIRNVEIGASEISGKIWYGRVGNAKMRIDRVAAIVSIRGPQGNFSGSCVQFDPANGPKPAF